ncbi:MAG: hypothetical protein ACFFE4_00400 [Candidatus Thorarchaeota archaeon]
MKAKCGYCGKKQFFDFHKKKIEADYLQDKCPVICKNCLAAICPYCGGKLEKESDSQDIREYCGNGCIVCEYEHCGSCI